MKKLSRIVRTTLAAIMSIAVQYVAAQTVTGTVNDANGQPMPGVAVVVKGTAQGTTTNIDGRYELKEVAPDRTLVFSFLGYVTQELPAQSAATVVMAEDVQTMGEVVVTTQKRRQTSIEVPTALSALSGLSMQRLNMQQMDEMAEFIPGLQVQLQSPNNPGYVIRGVTSDGGEAYSQPRISVFMDGISISRTQASAVELFDLERVEVAKGPQGTLFGRGAEIGAMHLLRNKPTNTLAAELTLNYGSHNQRGATGYINTPIITDKLANRFAFSYDAHDGYIDNLAGGDLNGKSAIALRNSLRFYSGENTVLDLVVDYQHDDYPGTSFKSRTLAPIGGDTNPCTAAQLEQGKALGIDRDNGGVTVNVDWTISNSLKLTSTTGFRAFRSDEKFDADGTYLALLQCREKAHGTQASQELRLNFDRGGRLSGFVGVSYFYEHASQDVSLTTNMQQLYPAYIQSQLASQLTSLTSLLPLLASAFITDEATLTYFNTALEQMQQAWFSASLGDTVDALPDFYGDIDTLLSYAGLSLAAVQQYIALGYLDLSAYGVSSDDVATAIATVQGLSGYELEEAYSEQATNYGINQALEAFADATYNIVGGLSVTAGLRATYEHQKTGYSSTTVAHPLFGAIMYAGSDGRIYASDDYTSWVGRLALNYMLKRNNFYASVSRGRRPGVIAFNNSPDDIIRLKPEIIVSYEVGAKGTVLKNRLTYDMSVYYYDWHHFQTTRLVDNDNSVAQTYEADDAGRAHTFGIEAGLRYAFTPQVALFGNYCYIDGKFNNTDGHGRAQEYAGNRFRLTPEHTFAVGIDANIKAGEMTTIFLRPSYSYKSDVYFEDSNDPLLTQDGYGIGNLTAGVRLQPKRMYIEVSVFGKNVFDEEYIVDAGNSGNQIGLPTYVAGAPSVWGGMLKVGF